MSGLFLIFALAAHAAAPAAPVVLTRAYAHNDYEHARPLFDALDHGFFGVEADVHLRGDELFVAHTGGAIKPGATLRTLYLDPLLKLVRQNGGRVYPGGPKGFLLMIEFKSDGEQSYSVLREMLAPYREMLTIYHKDRIEENAVTISITGHRPNGLLREEELRYAGIDGDLRDLKEPEKTLYPTISENFFLYFPLGGLGDLNKADRKRLKGYVEAAHARGRKIRFWGIPAKERLWDELYAAGVDLINTDDLDKLRDYLLKKTFWNRLAPETTAKFWNLLRALPADPFR
jgi:hypothetical protein